jgi:hypothetical protein
MSRPASSERVEKSDIEDALRSLQGGITDEIESRKQQVLMAVGIAAALLLVVAYLMGKRRGRRKTTFVEIRRF